MLQRPLTKILVTRSPQSEGDTSTSEENSRSKRCKCTLETSPRKKRKKRKRGKNSAKRLRGAEYCNRYWKAQPRHWVGTLPSPASPGRRGLILRPPRLSSADALLRGTRAAPLRNPTPFMAVLLHSRAPPTSGRFGEGARSWLSLCVGNIYINSRDARQFPKAHLTFSLIHLSASNRCFIARMSTVPPS